MTEIDANTTTVTDQAGKKRRSVTNALGQLVRVDEPDAAGNLGTVSNPVQPTYYAYDALNNLTTVSQGVQTRTFAYNSLSRLISATNPESGTINYSYDANGNLTSKTDARGVVTSYVYDALNRVTQRSYSTPNGTPGVGVLANYQATPNVSYFYDDVNVPFSKGRLTKVTSSISETRYNAFDNLGRVLSSSQVTDGQTYNFTYTYNLSGALIEQTYPSGRVVKNVLESDGDLSMVQSKKTANSGFFNYAKHFTYAASGAVTSMRLGNGLWESTQFNSRLQPTQIALGTVQNGADKLKLEYGYGTTANNGNVLSQKITVKRPSQSDLVFDQIYTYDSLNRITSAEEKTGTTVNWNQTYMFDRYGNRNFNESLTTTLPKGCVDGWNPVMCVADRKVFNPELNPANNRMAANQGWAYDPAGNTTADPQGRTFTYDAENKQIEVKNSLSATVGQYFFDGDGKRVKKVVPTSGEVTIFIYDAGAKLIGEYSAIVQSVQDAKVQYLTNDHLGSPRINTDRDGNVTSRTDYFPYGEEIIALGGRSSADKYVADDVRQGFTGYERDNETGLDFAQARVYAGYLGRFLSIDPAFESMMVAEPQSWNRYIYVLNNPLLLIDPNGELWIVAEGGKPQWVDKCPEKTICFTALALEHKNGGVIVFGSKNAEDITNYVANEDGMVDLNDLAKHHDANFIIAKDQAIPEEYLNGNAAAHLFTAAALYKVYYPNDLKLEFTAGSEKDGTPCTQANGRACHSGHFGNDIDIRYMDKHGNPIRKDSQAYKNADIGRTKFLILYFQGAGFDEIYTGNQALFGLPDGTPNVQTKNEKVHGNHLHVGKTENSYHNKKNPNRKKL